MRLSTKKGDKLAIKAREMTQKEIEARNKILAKLKAAAKKAKK